MVHVRTGSDAGLSAVAAHCASNLELVDVSGCGGAVSDKGVMALAEAAPHLTAIDLSGSAITEQGLKQLLSSCKQLQQIDISSCRSLPRHLRHAVAQHAAADGEDEGEGRGGRQHSRQAGGGSRSSSDNNSQPQSSHLDKLKAALR